MKKILSLCLLVFVTAIQSFAQDPGWPRQLTNNGSVLVLYTPQVETGRNMRRLISGWLFTDALSGETGRWRSIHQCNDYRGYL